MKIDGNILSIPPYISTAWRNVRTLYIKGNFLIISLTDGETVTIPGLSQETMEQVFIAHAAYLENDISTAKTTPHPGNIMLAPPMSFLQSLENEGPFKVSFGGLDGLGNAMQHNSLLANTPDLPQEVLNKVSSIAKIVTPEDVEALPKAEPQCNCIHCQIARAIHRGLTTHQDKNEEHEEVSDEDLQFQQWDIHQNGENLYLVTNKLEAKEQYQVFLGNPMGCTCGQKGCDHIVAVLRS